MFYYLLLCFISFLTGRGILRFIRLPLPIPLSYTIAPIITLALWTIALGWGTLLGLPGKHLWQITWLITASFAMAGLLTAYQELRRHQFNFSNSWVLLFIIFLPIATMAPYFAHGLLAYGGANAADGWSYAAVSQYLWELTRGTEGQLHPLYQYAAHLSAARFITYALLGFLSPLVNHPGDTQMAANLLFAWNIFNLTAACAFFSYTQKNKTLIPIYLTLVIFSGWTLNLLSVNNFDNALILPLLPVFAGIACIMDSSKKWCILPALLIATTLYCYMELAPFILCGALFFFIAHLRYKNDDFIQIILILMLTLLFALPYLSEAFTYLLNQLYSATAATANRPGEGMFLALLEPYHQLAAFWGSRSNLAGNLLGAVFTVLTIGGLIILWRRKQRSLVLFCLLLLAATALLLIKQHYTYGAYKLILLNWWLLMFCVVTAIDFVFKNTHYPKLIGTSFLFLGVIYLANTYSLQHYYDRYTFIKDITPFRQLSQIKSFVGDNAIKVDIKNDLANRWAIYFLKDYPIKLITYRSYMSQPHLTPYMLRAKTITGKIAFLLTDSPTSLPNKNLIWTSSGPYYLWKIENP